MLALKQAGGVMQYTHYLRSNVQVVAKHVLGEVLQPENTSVTKLPYFNVVMLGSSYWLHLGH